MKNELTKCNPLQNYVITVCFNGTFIQFINTNGKILFYLVIISLVLEWKI